MVETGWTRGGGSKCYMTGKRSGRSTYYSCPQHLDTCTFLPVGRGRGGRGPAPPVPRPRVGVKLGSGQGASAKSHCIATEGGLQGRRRQDRYTPTAKKGGEGGLFFSH